MYYNCPLASLSQIIPTFNLFNNSRPLTKLSFLGHDDSSVLRNSSLKSNLWKNCLVSVEINCSIVLLLISGVSSICTCISFRTQIS